MKAPGKDLKLTAKQTKAIEKLCGDSEGLIVGEQGDGSITFSFEDSLYRIDKAGKCVKQDSSVDQVMTGADPVSQEDSGSAGKEQRGDRVPSPKVSDTGLDEPGSDEQVGGAGGQTGSVPALPPVPMVDSLPQVQRPEVFEAMTLADERQVAAELEGRATKTMVYGFKVGGHMVYGLSWIGVREATRQMNARTSAEIRIDGSRPPAFEDITVLTEVGWDKDENAPRKEERPAIRVSVYAIDVQHGTGFWGTATVPRDQINKKKSDSHGYWVTNPDGFSANKALSKAQRNALEGHLPRELVEEIINLYRGTDQVEYIEGTLSPVQKELPPALTDDRALEAGGQARELYADLKRVAGGKVLTPGRFHQMFTAVQHDHQRLDDFVGYMTELVAKHKEGSDGTAD